MRIEVRVDEPAFSSYNVITSPGARHEGGHHSNRQFERDPNSQNPAGTVRVWRKRGDRSRGESAGSYPRERGASRLGGSVQGDGGEAGRQAAGCAEDELR